MPQIHFPDVMAVTTYFGNGIQEFVDEQGFTSGKLFDDPYWTSAQLQSHLPYLQSPRRPSVTHSAPPLLPRLLPATDEADPIHGTRHSHC